MAIAGRAFRRGTYASIGGRHLHRRRRPVVRGRRGRDRRADRPERRRQDHHAAVARRHPAADRRARAASTATTSSRDPLEAKRRLAFMPDEPHLFEYLTVDEHLRLVGAALRRGRFRARAAALLDELELTGKERSLPGELSRGMRQKVVIACGLVRDATTLLFDEPLTGLDPIGIRRMRETIIARGAGRRRDPAVVASAASGRGGLHPRHHHGPRTEDRRRHGRRAGGARGRSPRPARASSRSSCTSPAAGRPVGGLDPHRLPTDATSHGDGTGPVIGASLYIIVCSARNRVRLRLRRLREPRYLLGAMAGSAYLYFSIFRFGRPSRFGGVPLGRGAARRGRPAAAAVAGAGQRRGHAGRDCCSRSSPR